MKEKKRTERRNTTNIPRVRVRVYSYKDDIEDKDRATTLMQKSNKFDIVNRD